MKRLLILFFIGISIIHAQVGYIEYNNPVYDFLERMSAEHIINNYNSFELPKTRKKIGYYLKEVLNKKDILSSIDKKELNDFLIEFEYEINKTIQNSTSLFPNIDLASLNSEKEKFLFSYSDKNIANLFVNFVGDAQYLFVNKPQINYTQNTTIFNFGGLVRGSLYNKFGFSIKTTNGTFIGNRELAITTGSRRYNFKVQHTTTSDIGKDFFDETEGFLLADFDFLQFKIGRDRQAIGYGPLKYILSDNPPKMDYLSLNLNYKNIYFSYFHGKLLGVLNTTNDNIQGQINYLKDKFMVYHRIGINFSKHFQFGAGEIIIYGNRSIDISYLNPFNFYKSTEHANQDRDNSMLFFDFVNNSFTGLKFYSTFLIDDIDFGKLGTGWYGNQVLFNIGLYSSQLYHLLPVELIAQYMHIDPYVYTHRIQNNNYTSLSFGLGTSLQPNTELFLFKVIYSLTYRLKISSEFSYGIHGANDIVNNEIVNYGGDINIGHRVFDSEYVKFLDGFREYYRKFLFNIYYEPVNNYIFNISLMYENNDTRFFKEKKLFSNVTFSIKI